MEAIKIKVEKWTFNGSTSYKIIDVEKCCDEIRQNPLIDFYVESFENSEDECGVALRETDTYPEPWEDYYTTDYRYYKINRCPFCGELILIEVANELDKTDEHNKIKAEVYDIRKKITKCDSKKKTHELEIEFNKKNSILNSYYSDSSMRINTK